MAQAGLVWLWTHPRRPGQYVVRRKPKCDDIMDIVVLVVGAQQIMAKPTKNR